MSTPASQDHASPGMIAAYLDRRMAAVDRVRFTEHLAECTECRNDLVTAGRVLRSRGEKTRRLAAGAVIVLIGVGGVVLTQSSADRDDLLRAPAAGTQPVIVYAPLGEVARDSLQFTWAAAVPGTLFRLTVSGPTGATLWSVSTRDTTATPPRGLVLSSDHQLAWLLDALAPDGSERSSGLRTFRVRR